MNEQDLDRLRDAIAVSHRAREHGNHPFGAVLTDSSGAVVLEAENTVTTDRDVTGHAETNLVRLASKQIGAAALGDHTLFTSCEPCAMCSGAIYWSGIGRVVWAMTEAQLAEMTGPHDENPTMHLPAATVLASGQRDIEVAGPALSDDAMDAHRGFWY